MPMSPEEAKSCIILLLTTCPHPCRLRKLLRDFRKLKGHNMPLFGFDNHLELLKSFNDIVMVLDCGHERNPEIRLIRREPPPVPRTRDLFSGFDDDRDFDRQLLMNDPRIHNPTLPNVLIFQDEAAAYFFPPDQQNNRNEARAQLEEFGLIDDGIGQGVEEEEHMESIWDLETEMSATFLIRFCTRWLMEGFRMMWHKFTQSVGWSVNKNEKTLKDLIMDYSHVLQYIREGMGPNGWLVVEADLPPTEKEKTALSMRLNPELVKEIRGNIVKAVEVYFGRKEPDYTIGLPVQKLQKIYKELFGCLVRFEILGFDTLASFCLAIDGDGFRVCKIGTNYVVLPPLKPWLWPEPELEGPIILRPEPDLNALPKDVIGPDDILQELNFKLYLKAGETMKITFTNYENPLDFHFIPYQFYSVYQEFTKGLMQFYSSNNRYNMPQEFVRPGQYCVVDYWNSELTTVSCARARVIELTEEGGANVILIDNGKKFTVSVYHVKFLHKQFASFPVHGLPACLAGLVPRNAVMDEVTMTKINFYLKEPFLEAELYSPDFNRPMFPMILYSRFSKISLNRVLIDSGKFDLKPTVSYSILTRKLGDIHDRRGGNSDERCRRMERWGMTESEPLLSDFSDSDDENFLSEVEIRLPRLHQADCNLRLAVSRPERAASLFRAPPVDSPPESPEPSGSDIPPADSRPDDFPLNISLLDSLQEAHPLPSLGIPQSRANEERQENPSQEEEQEEEEEEEKEEEETDYSKSEEPLINVFKLPMSKKIEKKLKGAEKPPTLVEAKEEECPKLLQSKGSGVEATSSSGPNKKSVPKKTSSLCSPSTSNDETNSDESDSSEATSVFDDFHYKNVDMDEVWGEMEMYMLTIKMMNSNSIIRQITQEAEYAVFTVANSWAKYILETNDESLFDPEGFNPYALYGNTPIDQIPRKLRSLTEQIPQHLNKKLWILSKCKMSSRNPANHNKLLESKDNTPLEGAHGSEDDTSAISPWELNRVKNMYCSIISIKKIKGRNLTEFEVFFNETSFMCNADEVRMLSKIQNTDIIEKLKKNKRVVIKWSLNDTLMKIKMDRFQRFFFGLVNIRFTLDDIERNAKPWMIWHKFSFFTLFFKPQT